MKTPFIHILSLLLCLTNLIQPQAQNYSSRKLAETGDLFPKTCLPATDSIFHCPQITKVKSFTVNYNCKQEIAHLGISLFSPETKEMINLPVCNFIERVMLELLLQKSSGDVQSKLREYNIRLQKDGVEYGNLHFTSLSKALEELQSPTQFIIYKDSIYAAQWQFEDNGQLSLAFPASRELIFGTDKMESDAELGELFTNHGCEDTMPEALQISAEDVTHITGTDLYLRKGTHFQTDKINSDSYYQRSDTLFQAVFSPEYPAESLANLFLTKQIPDSLSLKITHRMYGGVTPQFAIPLNRFICLFNREFDSYCTLNRAISDNVQVSVVLHNRDYNYMHLLRIKTTSEQLFNPQGVLDADIYTNIPLHNLKSLF